jgi:hypothetical protein
VVAGLAVLAAVRKAAAKMNGALLVIAHNEVIWAFFKADITEFALHFHTSFFGCILS